MRTRVLVCGNLLVYGLHGVSMAADADRAKVWQAVSEVIYRVRRAEKLAGSTDIVLLKDFDGAARKDSSILGKLSYGAVETKTVLSVNPARAPRGLSAEPGSKFRSDIKNRVFKFDEAGCSIELLDDVAVHAGPATALSAGAWQRGFEAFHRAGQLLAELAELAGANARARGAPRRAIVNSSSVCWMAKRRSPITSVHRRRRRGRAGVRLHASLARAIEAGARRVRSAGRRSSPRRGWDASPRGDRLGAPSPSVPESATGHAEAGGHDTRPRSNPLKA
jgi:hypothetical protein